ncbi:MAG: type II secretion system F family protein [Ornithinimicrobium sp.]
MTVAGPWVLGLAAALSALAVVVCPHAPGPWHLRRRQRDRRALRGELPTPELPEVLDHIALALRGGAGVQPALRQVASVTPGAAGHELAAVAAAMAWGLDDDAAWANAPRRWQPAQRALVLAARGGVPPSDLLIAAASDLRRDAVARVELQTAQLAVRLVLPLGLAFLPAFVLTTVVPVVIALATSVLQAP